MKNNKIIKVLLVDDHHLILEGYKNVLSQLNFEDFELTIDTANNCDLALDKMRSQNFNVIFLDINFPISENNKILSGDDLGMQVKKEFSNIKIIVLTVLEDTFRLQNILSHLNPNGFLLKGETTSQELIRCFKKVMTGSPYFGSKISKILHSNQAHKFYLDQTDRTMLYQLSLGTKTKDITTHVNLSLRAVEDRKRKLKEIFGVSGQGNRALLEKARESGYI